MVKGKRGERKTEEKQKGLMEESRRERRQNMRVEEQAHDEGR